MAQHAGHQRLPCHLNLSKGRANKEGADFISISLWRYVMHYVNMDNYSSILHLTGRSRMYQADGCMKLFSLHSPIALISTTE